MEKLKKDWRKPKQFVSAITIQVLSLFYTDCATNGLKKMQESSTIKIYA